MEGDERTVSLEWKGHGQALTTGIWNLFKEHFLVDISVTCRGHCVRVHKLALAVFLPSLKDSLSTSGEQQHQQQQQRQQQAIDLDVYVRHADDVQYLLEFIYTGRVRRIPEEHVGCLMSVAESMGIDGLADTIRAHPAVQQSINSDDAVDGFKPVPVPVPSYKDGNHQDDMGLMDGILRMLLAPEDVVAVKDMNSDVVEKAPDSKDLPQMQQQEDTSEPPSSPKELRRRSNRRYTLRSRCARNKTPDVVSIGDDGDQEESEPIVKAPLNRRCKSRAAPTAKCRKRRAGNTDTVGRRIPRKEVSVGGDRVGDYGSPGSKRIGMERLQKCNYCDHSTWQKNVLVQHLAARHKVDLKGNPLPDMKCSQCEFVCVAKHQLNQHVQRKHTVDKPFKCRQCSYTAVFRSDFNKHVQIQHLKKRDFMCDVCGFRSQTKGGLNAHARTHERIKPLKCDTCGAEYSDTLSYRLHVQNHTGNVVNTYVCHVCGHGCRRRSQLRIHLRKKHGIELESGRRKYGSVALSSDVGADVDDDANGPTDSASSLFLGEGDIATAIDFHNLDSDPRTPWDSDARAS